MAKIGWGSWKVTHHWCWAFFSNKNIEYHQLTLTLCFYTDQFCVFYLSGVNIKVRIHASGPDRINVLPPRKGTVYLQSNVCSLCVMSHALIYSIHLIFSATFLAFYQK